MKRIGAASFFFVVTSSACPPAEPPPFNPPEVICPSPVELADTSTATRVGDGTAASCTEAAFDNALATHNGAVFFNCGPEPVVVPITTTKIINEDVVIDGGSLVTLDGQNNIRIIEVASSFELDTPHVTLQRLGFIRGRASGTDLSGGGAAVTRVGGVLDVIDCVFDNNHGNTDGQDTAGGAIFSQGGGATTVSGSTFTNNTCSNGGAIGSLVADLVVVNSTFESNEATGNGGNPGNGGNGGSIVIDGDGRAVTLCGVAMRGSKANAFGGGMFRIGYQFTEPTDIDRVVVTGEIEDREPSMGGGLYLQGTIVNMTSSTILSSTATHAGGVYMGPGSTVNFANVSFLDNVAGSSLGGGLFLDGTNGGTIINSTFAGNRAPGELAFGGAIVGQGEDVVLRNSLILESFAGNGFNPISCTTRLNDGRGSFQFPVERSGAGSDEPDALCAPSVTVADIALGEIDKSGVVPVRKPAPGTAADGAGRECPATDALGNARDVDGCTAGAVE